MSAITNDQAILQASIEANVVTNEAVAADLQRSESLDALTEEQVAGARLVFNDLIVEVQTQINYLIQLDSATDTATTAWQIQDLDTQSSILI